MLSTTQLLSILIGAFIPVVNGLVTKYGAAKARVYLQLVLNAGNGFLVTWLHALTTAADFNLTEALTATALSLLTAIATQAGVWAPLGTSHWAKTNGVGSARPAEQTTGESAA